MIPNRDLPPDYDNDGDGLDDEPGDHCCPNCGGPCDCIDGDKRGKRYCIHCEENSWG